MGFCSRRVRVCVSLSGVLFSVGVCVCDLLIFLAQGSQFEGLDEVNPIFLYHTTHITTAERRAEKQCRRRGASSGQKTKRGIEGERPGRRRYREVLLPERFLVERRARSSKGSTRWRLSSPPSRSTTCVPGAQTSSRAPSRSESIYLSVCLSVCLMRLIYLSVYI